MPYTGTWDEAFPPDTQAAKLLGEDIRSFKTQIREYTGTYISGDLADRLTPAPIWAGLLYWAVDTGQIFRWDGSTWIDVTSAFIPASVDDVDFVTTPVFDGSLGNVFEITLTANVASSTFINITPGRIYTWIIHQDAGGGNTFAWPTNVPGALIADDADSTSVQSFIAGIGGVMYPISGMTVS